MKMTNHHEEILFHMNRTQLSGLGCLVFLAIREKSTLEYQWKEWGFEDISLETILEFELEDEELMELASAIAVYVLEDLTIEKAIA